MLEAKEAPIGKIDYAVAVGWSPSWLSRVLARRNALADQALPLEVLVRTLMLPGVPPDAFAGTAEHNVLQALPRHHRRFIELVAAHGHRAQAPGEPLTRQNIAEFFAQHGVSRPRTYWRQLLDGKGDFPEGAEMLAKLARALEVAPEELGVPPAPPPDPNLLARIAVDQLVNWKLSNLRSGGPYMLAHPRRDGLRAAS